jgi:5-methylcytosine-specific restriction endonuclease McrA
MNLPFRPVPKPKHKRKIPKQAERNKFTEYVRDQVKEHFENTCQMCYGKGLHIHHVYPRGRGGRNVFTNALLLCNECHKEIHANEDLLRHWIELYKEKHGEGFWKDEHDLKREFEDKRLTEQLRSYEME